MRVPSSLLGLSFLCLSLIACAETDETTSQVKDAEFCRDLIGRECETENADRCRLVEVFSILPDQGCVRRSDNPPAATRCSEIAECNDDVSIGASQYQGETQYAVISGCVDATEFERLSSSDVPASISMAASKECADLFAMTDDACRSFAASECPTEFTESGQHRGTFDRCQVVRGFAYDGVMGCVDETVETEGACRLNEPTHPWPTVLSDIDGQLWWFPQSAFLPLGDGWSEYDAGMPSSLDALPSCNH